MKPHILQLVSISALACIAGGPVLAAPAQPESFAFGGQPWAMFVPKESEPASCRMAGNCSSTHSGQPGVILASNDFARYGMRPYTKSIPVIGGERYRLSAWVKADQGCRVESGTAGLLLRATLFVGPAVDYPGGHYYVGAKGVVLGADPAPLADAPLPSEWTKLEGVVEIPAGVRTMMLFVFCWKTSGQVCIDQATIEKVDGSTPLTKVLVGK